MRALVLLFLVFPALQGCGLLGPERGNGPREVDITSVVIEMHKDVNNDWPARVDLIRVGDARIYSGVLAIDTGAWFDGTSARRFIDGNPDAYVDRWEIVPGTSIGPFDIELSDDVGAVLLCDVASAPPPKAVALEGDLLIIVTDAGCTIRERD